MASPLRVVACATLLLASVVACAVSSVRGPNTHRASTELPATQEIRYDAPSTAITPVVSSHPGLLRVRRVPASVEARVPRPVPAPPLLELPGLPQVILNIVLNYPDRHLRVTQHIRLVNATDDPWDEIVFSVPPARTPGVFMLDPIAGATMEGTMLTLTMTTPVLPGEPVSITLAYEINIPDVSPTDGHPEGNLGAGERVIQMGDWHPTLVPYLPGLGWQRWSYHAIGDPVIYPIADYDVRLYADPSIVIAAPGVATRQGLLRRYELQQARSFALLASPDYRLLEADAGGIPLRAYVLPGYAGAGQHAVDVASRAILQFSDLFGPYPTDGLVIAQNAYSGSMEYSGLISLSRQAFEVYRGSPQALLTRLTVHEVAHQWWYGAVGSDQVHEPWLDEALARYSELLYYERYAPDLVDWWWAAHFAAVDGAIDGSIYDFDTSYDYIRQVYGQGARFIHDVRRWLGDEQFFAFLRAYRDAGEGRLMGTDDFVTILQAHSERDPAPLIGRYFSAGGLPIE